MQLADERIDVLERPARRPAIEELLAQSNVERLWHAIRRVRFALLVTRGLDGTLRVQPLTTQNREANADNLLYFLVAPRNMVAVDVGGGSAVMVIYADPENDCYVSVNGSARLRRDPALQQQLLSRFTPAFFPALSDPQLHLLEVRIDAIAFSDAYTVAAALKAPQGQP